MARIQYSGIGRREFLRRMAASGLALKTDANGAAGFRRAIRAVAFDAFPILDPRPVFALVEELYPERGVDLSNVWRTRQFEYTWLRTISRRYSDFWHVTDDALVFAAKAVKVELTPVSNMDFERPKLRIALNHYGFQFEGLIRLQLDVELLSLVTARFGR